MKRMNRVTFSGQSSPMVRQAWMSGVLSGYNAMGGMAVPFACHRPGPFCARVIATATKGLFWLRDHRPGDTLAHGLKRSQRGRKASVLRALLPPLREPICACTRIQ